MREIFNTTTIMTIGTTKAYTLSASREEIIQDMMFIPLSLRRAMDHHGKKPLSHPFGGFGNIESLKRTFGNKGKCESIYTFQLIT
jgi:hypothetical protein